MSTSSVAGRITSVRFKNYKALRDFHLRLTDTNFLIGPNNAGKSTIISAFRVLAIALRRVRGKRIDTVNGPKGRSYGIVIPGEALPISLENVHTDYADEDTTINGLNNGLSVLLDLAGFLGPEAGLAKAGFGMGMGLVGTVSSAINGDTKGSLGGIGGFLWSPIELNLEGVKDASEGFGQAAEGAPIIGTALNGFALYNDYKNYGKSFDKCMNELGGS